MNNSYRKDRNYIKQRLEYVSPVDYIIELENKIDNLQQENEKLNNRINKATNILKLCNRKSAYGYIWRFVNE